MQHGFLLHVVPLFPQKSLALLLRITYLSSALLAMLCGVTIFSGLSCCFAVRALLRHRVKARPLLCAFVFFWIVPRLGLCSVTAIKPMAGSFVWLARFPGRFKRKGWTNVAQASPIPVNHSKAPSFSESRSRKNPAFLLRKVRQLRVEKVTLESPPGIKTDDCGRACVCRSAPRAAGLHFLANHHLGHRVQAPFLHHCQIDIASQEQPLSKNALHEPRMYPQKLFRANAFTPR